MKHLRQNGFQPNYQTCKKKQIRFNDSLSKTYLILCDIWDTSLGLYVLFVKFAECLLSVTKFSTKPRTKYIAVRSKLSECLGFNGL